MNPDIRWKQRFQNFDRAFGLLDSALAGKSLDDFSALEQEGLIQRFEYTYELAWKTLKDYMEENGLEVSPLIPRNVIKEAFAAKILDEGQVWIDMMMHRNLLSHTYDQAKFKEILKVVQARYLGAFKNLHAWLLKKREEA